MERDNNKKMRVQTPMQAGTRDALSCMDRHRPQDPTAMSPDLWSNLTWDSNSAGSHDLLVQLATWTGNATVRTIRESWLLPHKSTRQTNC